jgi:Uncharacterised protein family (UPF0236)
MPPTDRDRQIDALLARYRKLLEQRLPTGPQRMDEIEQTVEEISREMQRELTHRILEEQEPSHEAGARCCCGALARERGLRQRRVITIHGEQCLWRRYYYCDRCRSGFAPLDEALGLDQGATTLLVRQWIATAAAKLVFAEAADLLALLTPVAVSGSTVERVAVATGKALAADQQRTAHLHQQGQLPVPDRRPTRLYISMDGKMTPLRDPWHKDGSAGALHCRYGECKTGAVYEARSGPEGDRGVQRVAYVATLEDVTVFTPLIATLAHQHGHHLAKEVIVLGDGAAWIWLIAAAQFPSAVQILDFFHVSERLCLLANARFGEGTEAAKEWVTARQTELKTDQIEAVLADIAAWKPKSTAKRELREQQYRFLANNAERMRYGTYLKKGYQIGSGVIESACGHVVGQRLDQAGMHWREGSAEAMVCLRAALRSTTPPDLRPYCAMAA